MAEDQTYCILLTTAGSQEEADKLAAGLVENRLAACVQITNITSYYFWNDQVNHDPELLLLIKTRSSLYPQIEAFLSQHHSYDLPEIVQVPIQGGLPGYLNWIAENTGAAE